MRGIVHWRDSNLALLTEELELVWISDYDELYADMSLTKVEIVDMDVNEVTKMMCLKSLFGNTLYKEDQPCLAEEAIDYALKFEPSSLVRMMKD